MNYVSIEKKKGEIFEEKDFGEVSDNKKNKISVYRLLEMKMKKKKKRNKTLYAK